MVRGALWLVQTVGEGGIFTKNDIRLAFPGISQADRRIRDLRKYGWVLHSSTEDVRLAQDEQRFVSAGVAVWDSRARRNAASGKPITNKERAAALERADYLCSKCGIGSAEPYPDDSVATAVLGISRRETRDAREATDLLVVECNRCRSGSVGATLSVDEVLIRISMLDEPQMRRLKHWIERGRRGTTELDRAWSGYRQLPEVLRSEITAHIVGKLESPGP